MWFNYLNSKNFPNATKIIFLLHNTKHQPGTNMVIFHVVFHSTFYFYFFEPFCKPFNVINFSSFTLQFRFLLIFLLCNLLLSTHKFKLILLILCLLYALNVWLHNIWERYKNYCAKQNIRLGANERLVRYKAAPFPALNQHY